LILQSLDYFIYNNFIAQALVGFQPQVVDQIFMKYESRILKVANELNAMLPRTILKLYRGIILPENLCHKPTLTPISSIKYISCSVDKKAAEVFADINHPMGVSFKGKGIHHGFIIELEANPEEVLYHYSWARLLGLYDFLDKSVLDEQKEVILKQTWRTFKLTKFS
jgi:hypothetical protein